MKRAERREAEVDEDVSPRRVREQENGRRPLLVEVTTNLDVVNGMVEAEASMLFVSTKGVKRTVTCS